MSRNSPSEAGKPCVRSLTGRLIDGTQFDSTEGESLPALFKVRDLIMGWQIALTRMNEGDKYRIWIPAICGSCFQVGEEVPNMFKAEGFPMDRIYSWNGPKVDGDVKTGHHIDP